MHFEEQQIGTTNQEDDGNSDKPENIETKDYDFKSFKRNDPMNTATPQFMKNEKDAGFGNPMMRCVNSEELENEVNQSPLFGA